MQGNTTMSGGSNQHKQHNQQHQGVWDSPVPNKKKPQPCIGLFPIARPQHTNATVKTIPDNSRTPPTDRSVHLQDPQRPKRQEASRERNNHCKDRSVQANLPANSRNSHPTIVTFVATVTYWPPTHAYSARRGQRWLVQTPCCSTDPKISRIPTTRKRVPHHPRRQVRKTSRPPTEGKHTW